MRKYALIAALVLVSATAQAGATRGPNLGPNLASNDEPAATAAQPSEPAKATDAPQAVETAKPTEAPKFVDRPAPVSTTADTPKAEVTKPAPPRRRRPTSRSAGTIGAKRASSANCTATGSIGRR